MQTIIVDDKSAVVSMLQRILKRVDPAGTHTGYTEADNALQETLRVRAYPMMPLSPSGVTNLSG